MTKSELGQAYLARQRSLTEAERKAMSERIAETFFNSLDLTGIRSLHCFIPIEKFNEVDTRVIIDRIWRDFAHIRVVVPRVDLESNQIQSLVFERETPLVRSRWDIDEPEHDDIVDAKDIDMVLVPGLCFDRLGYRVGYGKGFYDRFLKTCRYNCVRVGLSYFDPVDRIDDVHDGDARLDVIVTPIPNA